MTTSLPPRLLLPLSCLSRPCIRRGVSGGKGLGLECECAATVGSGEMAATRISRSGGKNATREGATIVLLRAHTLWLQSSCGLIASANKQELARLRRGGVCSVRVLVGAQWFCIFPSLKTFLGLLHSKNMFLAQLLQKNYSIKYFSREKRTRSTKFYTTVSPHRDPATRLPRALLISAALPCWVCVFAYLLAW